MMKTETMQERSWKSILRVFFDLPACVILLIGDWKVGKTDFSLRLAEDLYTIGIIKKAFGNIEASPSKETKCPYTFLNDLESMKAFTFRDRIPKLGIYDESLTSTPSRKAMSKLSIELAFGLIPQLSKGKAKFLVLSQTEEYQDSVFYNTTFLKGVIEKISLTKAVFRSTYLNDGEFYVKDIPKTTFGFDPYLTSVLKLKPEIKTDEWGDNRKMLLDFSHGKTYAKLAKKYGGYPMTVKRTIQHEIEKILLDPKINIPK